MAKQKANLAQYAGIVQGATQRAGDNNIAIHLIDVERQVRTQFDPEKQASINASIKAQGINQSLVLLAKPDGRYRLIAGEYRYRGALANELATVPARVRHDLSDMEIRRIQVSENMERTDISAYDEALGVAEDVERFGFDVAREVWNRSEGWVSKRTAVLKYAEPLKKLLQENICNDLEIAHSLNQVYDLAPEEFARLEKRLRDGVPLTRNEARGKVQQVKEWRAENKQRKERLSALKENEEKPSDLVKVTPTKRSAAKQLGEQGNEESSDTSSAHDGKGRTTGLAQRPASAESAATVSADNIVTLIEKGEEAATIAVSGGLTDEQQRIVLQMATLFGNGIANHNLVKDVQEELARIGADMNETEWALWSLYQTAVLPLLAALGEARAMRYLQRSVSELRNAAPQALWQALHPTVDDVQSDDWSAPRVTVAPMPKDWRF
jgi:ParB family chromosome partitioning protein